ncbi:CoA binding domain protein [Acididesulfobacillus acetoxydans]|uniref:CoA binding domain protein n=1 Tax=Acididesulfobacillus acetoxydans TaxID=1561005 RepID=A0A8S0W3Y1_9FIRM|nr:CoA-binding protein [Acididesulfobacillus acetoxydans]CAA7602088.1 CoA binding domain protein [Acididesulfobacillus acetoxydans]CEJ08069.1 CoA-binding-like protein [Acididesulfobacillus acetoxydans]
MREKKIHPFTESLHTGLSYAVIGSKEELRQHRHAWKAWRALQGFGCTVYLVAAELKRWEGAKVYPDLPALTGKVQVAVPCLSPEEMPDLVAEALAAGVEQIWFQEQSWSPEMHQQCELAGIQAVRGCVLRHRTYRQPLGYFHPCFWHGLRDLKVPLKRHL